MRAILFGILAGFTFVTVLNLTVGRHGAVHSQTQSVEDRLVMLEAEASDQQQRISEVRSKIDAVLSPSTPTTPMLGGTPAPLAAPALTTLLDTVVSTNGLSRLVFNGNPQTPIRAEFEICGTMLARNNPGSQLTVTLFGSEAPKQVIFRYSERTQCERVTGIDITSLGARVSGGASMETWQLVVRVSGCVSCIAGS